MDYFFTEEQKQVQKLARRIAEEKVMPVRAEMDETETFPREIMRACADTGLLGVSLPEAYGGLGGGITESCLVVEELSRACLGVSVTYAASLLGAYPILVGGSEKLKKRYLPQLSSGKRLAAFGLTEANAGSDALGIRTEARLDGRSLCPERDKAMDHEWRRSRDLFSYSDDRPFQREAGEQPDLCWKKGWRASVSARKRRSWVSGHPPRASLLFRIAGSRKKMSSAGKGWVSSSP